MSEHNHECTISGERCGFRCTGYDGSGEWAAMHAAADRIGCDTCREHGKANVSGLHDHVNAGLSKTIHDKDNYQRFVREVNCVYSKCVASGECKPL